MHIPVLYRQPKVFVMSTPQHLLGKLYWEIDRFREAECLLDALGAHLVASYHAANCAITAWHMTDWVWESLKANEREDLANRLILKDTRLETFQDYVRAQCRSLHLCYELATGAKHRNPQNKKMEAVVQARDTWEAELSTVESSVDEPLARYTFELMVEDGERSIALRDVFQDVLIYWKELLRNVGLLEDRLVFAHA